MTIPSEERCLITKVVIKNYKSIDSITVHPNDSLSVFIGRNGSGKTVFLSALTQLIKSIDSRRPFYHPFKNQDSFEKSGKEPPAEIIVTFLVFGLNIQYSIKILDDDDHSNNWYAPKIEEGWVINDKKKVTSNVPMSLLYEMLFRHKSEDYGIRLNLDLFSTNSEFSLPEISPYESHLKSILDYVHGMKYYSAIQFAQPSECPSTLELDEVGDRQRFRSTSSLSRFLFDLYQLNKEQRDAFEVFNRIVCNPKLELIDKIEFSEHEIPSYDVKVRAGGKVIKRQTKKKIVVPFFHKDSYKLSPSQLSEGTFKTIALLFYVINYSGSALLVEEPEVCVHHGLLDNILDIIKSYSHEKQVFLTTHSESVLDSVEPENVFVVKWNKRTEVSNLANFLGANGLAVLKRYLTTSGNLGEYIRHRSILDE